MKQFLYIVFFFFLVSCTSRTIYKKPDDLIPKEQMIALWTDIYLAKGAENIKNINLERESNYLYLIYEKYKIDSVRFMRSNIYYTSKAEDYKEMFIEVEKSLIKLKYKDDPDMKDVDLNLPVKKLDSIKNARSSKKEKLEEDIEEKKILLSE